MVGISDLLIRLNYILIITSTMVASKLEHDIIVS